MLQRKIIMRKELIGMISLRRLYCSIIRCSFCYFSPRPASSAFNDTAAHDWPQQQSRRNYAKMHYYLPQRNKMILEYLDARPVYRGNVLSWSRDYRGYRQEIQGQRQGQVEYVETDTHRDRVDIHRSTDRIRHMPQLKDR